MRVEDIARVAVVGAGLMGHGIAQEFAAAGYRVRVNDRSPGLLGRALENIRRNLGELARAGRIAADRVDETLSRIGLEPSLEAAVSDADVVIEAVFEDLDLKRRIFAQMDRVCPRRTIFLSNTSTFLPSKLASATARPDRVAVAHFFNPPHLLPLVELVRGPETSDETMATARALLAGIGKRPALVQKEVPGFIGNRLQAALIREAIALVESGVASPADVDTVVRYGFGRRLAAAGPLEVWELAGWDLISVIIGMLLPDIDASTSVPPVLEQMVARGDLGVKSGRGFYDWTPDSANELRQRIGRALLEMSQWD